MRALLLYLFLLAMLLRPAQADQMKRILRLLDRQEIEKAVSTLVEELEVSPNHAGYLWIGAELAISDTLPYYSLDSAYVLCKASLVAFDSADADQLKEYEKVPFEKVQIEVTDRKIRSLIWEETQRNLSISTIGAFRSYYPDAPENTRAIFQRDSLAFLEVSEKSTWEAFKQYLEDYPQSSFYQEALSNYELLLYQDKTSSGVLESYESFVSQYPGSPFRERAIAHILQLKLFWNDTRPLTAFVNDYPKSKHVQRALDYLYHLAPYLLDDPMLFQRYERRDSLEGIHRQNQKNLFLFQSENSVKAIDLSDMSASVLPIQSLLGKQKYCNSHAADYFAGKAEGSGVLINRLNQSFYLGSFVDHKDIGLGAIYLKKTSSGLLIHKTGQVIIDEVEDAEVIADRWIKVKRSEKWALISLNGTLLCPFVYDDIFLEGNFWVFEKAGLYAFSNSESINEEAGSGGFTLMFKYDDYEKVDEEWMIGFKGEMEGLINDQLNFIIPWDKHVIFPNRRVPYAKKNGRYTLYPRLKGISQSTFDNVLISRSWLAYQSDNWVFCHLSNPYEKHTADSLRLIGDDHLYKLDSSGAFLFFDEDSVLTLEPQDQVVLLESSGDLKFEKQEHYIQIINEEKRSIYGSNNKPLFEIDGGSINPIGDSLFVHTIAGDRSGVRNAQGEWLVEPNFDYVGRRAGVLNLLNNNQIGAYFLQDSILIDAEYSSYIEPYGSYYTTSQGAKEGLIDSLGEVVLTFQYNDLSYLSDTMVWVKTDSSWQIQQIVDDRVIQYGIRSFEPMLLQNERFFKVTTSTGYGIVDQQGRYLVSPSFSDIRSVSDGLNHLFVCEKSVPEAGFYLWVGFDAYGKKVFSEAYREEVYEEFACD